MKNIFDKCMKSFLYRTAGLLYAIFPKKPVLRFYCNLANMLRPVTWRLACRYYGPEIIKYRGGVGDFILSEVGKDDLVIDVGCAEGNLTSLVAAKARSVVGVDMDNGYIDSIDKKIRDLKNVKFIRGDVSDIDFREIFDAAILVHTIEHMPDCARILRKLSDISRKIIIETPDPDSDCISKILNDLGVHDLGDDKHFELFNRKTLRDILEKNGWGEVVVSTGDGVVRALARSLSLKGEKV